MSPRRRPAPPSRPERLRPGRRAAGRGGRAVHDPADGVQRRRRRLVGQGEPEVLAERIYMLLSDTPQWRKMSQAAQESAKAYSWQRIADKMIEIFIDATLEKTTRPHII